MKSKTILIASFLVLALFLSPVQTLRAADETHNIQTLLSQIAALRQEILRLQDMLASAQDYPKVTTQAFIAVNLSDNTILMQKNADQKRIIASVTKLMSAVVAKEHISQSQTITLTPQMLTPEGYSPALFAGLIISRDNLLKASLVQSTNDAAESLTYFLGKETFLSLMSQKTKELGMEHTLFYDAHGLSPQNTSTASDLAKLVAYIHKQHPEILAMTKENNFQLPGSAGTLFTFQNLNSFSAYPEFVGGKVGWLPEAQQTFASVFQVNGKPVTVIVLGSKDRKADTLSILNSLKTRASF